MEHLCPTCKKRMALVSGTFYFSADSEPFENGIEEEVIIDEEEYIHGYFCLNCNELKETWIG